MQVKTTGVEQWMPDGEAHLKTMIIGGPGAGKTRWSSFWPEPIYLNYELGLASVADRGVAYLDIASSEETLNALRWLKDHRDAKRFGTVVVDTIDAYARILKQEWLDANPNAATFTGYDAWGYLENKLQMLLTRLLQLDKNVVVLVHYKERTVTERDDNGEKSEVTYFQLQLQGDTKDSIFADFDLVGWMDTFWKPGPDGRVEARGITFTRSPQRPFLKDRLHITPKWLEVTFSEEDYSNLFKLYLDKVDTLKEGGLVAEVPLMPDDRPIKGTAADPLKGGALPPEDPRDLPLDQLKKGRNAEDEGTLLWLAAEEGVPNVKANDLKGDIVKAIEAHRAAKAAEPEPESEPDPDGGPVEPDDSSASEGGAPETSKTDASTDVQPDEVVESPAEPEAAAEEAAPEPVNEAEGEVKDPEAVIREELGGELQGTVPASDEEEKASEPEPEPESKPAPSEGSEDPLRSATCESCGKEDLSNENRDWVRLGYIKFRKYLCNKCYQEAKAG